VRKVPNGWGAGHFDAELFLDGKAFRPDGKTAAVLIPPAFGLAGVNLHTWTGWGSVTYWNAFVAVLEMHGKGNFFDPRLNDMEQFPVAAQNGFADVKNDPDLVTSKLAPLHFYQLGLVAPTPPKNSFNEDAAERGKKVFEGQAKCASCHVAPLFTEPGWNMHTPEEIGVDDFQANRAPDKRYRTSPLKGVWTPKVASITTGGLRRWIAWSITTTISPPNCGEHVPKVVVGSNAKASRAAALSGSIGLNLSQDQKADLVQYLKSL
jgi:hypothetical protein